MIRLSRRVTDTAEKSYGMCDKAAAFIPQEGLIHLELGRPYYDTPQHIKDATIRALQAGEVHYSDMRGNAALRQALADQLASRNSMVVDPDQIIVTNGLTQASFMAFMAVVDAGDEVIVLDPYYPQHIGKIEMAGGRVVPVPLDAAEGFRIRPEWIEAKVTARTRALVLVNPGNPTGRVYTEGELASVADIATRHNLVVIADEVYEHITYDGAKHVSIASLPHMSERTISMFAFTKAYAMDGWRLGYAVASGAIIQGMAKIFTSEVTHVNTFIQHGALAAVTGPYEPIQAMIDADRRNRDLMVQRLNCMPNVTCDVPQGSIYAFPDISRTGYRAQALAETILESAGVVVEAGSFYGTCGEGHLRLCFGSQPYESIEEAMDRLSGFFAALRC
ncbi:MAG: aspartate aminotransferase [Gammaproteobacteria bacterium]|jgi:aspartate aminotransferase|nr:aspartate aminotransferase [Gammaproteobacteria bacterium]